ncbi:MAG: SufD family Fe-S cluster assembly protein [Spirochaetia bacterium]|nr:SufD family Fe-S cluster assembly protein [Spirochaetia bacterium]
MNAISNPPAEAETSWLNSITSKARKAFEKMELPVTDESWRKIDLSGLELNTFQSGTSQTSLTAVSGESRVKTFHELTEDDRNSPLYKIFFQNLTESLDKIPDIFHAQNLSEIQNGALIEASKTPETVKLTHKFTSKPQKGSALFHRVFIHVPDNCDLTVYEEFKGTPSEEITLWNIHTTAVCGKNASLKYIASGRFTDNEYHFHNFESIQERDSSVHLTVLHEGGISGKSFYTGKIKETGGHFRGIGLGLGRNREFNDIEMAVEHYADHSESSLYYRTVLKDRSHSVFTGNLFIPSGLKDVQSHQMNNNVLLDKKARAESIPKLIIKAESVQCDHGATVGEINEDALLYLKCRGIPEDDAKSLLVEGFANEIIDEIPLEEIRERIRDDVKGRMLQ